MIADGVHSVAIEPIVSWPRQAVAGRTYLLTVDLRLAEGAAWPYAEEEYEIGCRLNVGPACDVRVLRQAGVVLHRFGVTYGPAEFLLTAHAPEDQPRLMLTLVNSWGVPIDHIPLEMSVVASSDVEAGTAATVTVEGRGKAPATPPKVYISYRRGDTAAAARMLAERFAERFGQERVRFDTATLARGVDWQDDIGAAVADADITVAVIGRRWLASTEAQRLDPETEDVLRVEIERALREGVPVIPVLVDGAVMPRKSDLPRPFRPLTGLQAVTVGHDRWDSDVEALIDLIERTRRTPLLAWGVDSTDPSEAQTSDGEIQRVARHLDEGSLVFFLGAGVNSTGRPAGADRDPGSPPDADELARDLARRFRLQTADLAAIAEEVRMTSGTLDLHRTLREALSHTTPGPIHRWFAALPSMLRSRGRERGQLLITLNYDDALERAFDDAHEPYDLMVFIADGREGGRFLHVPWWSPGGPQLIDQPNAYVDFPIDEDFELERTVIAKMLGSATIDVADLRPKGSYVIAEDDYIDYLSGSPIEALLPVQILSKIRESHALFVAGSPRDEGLRVLMRRLWGRDGPGAASWAVQREMREFERQSWSMLKVRPLEVDPVECLTHLGALLIND